MKLKITIDIEVTEDTDALHLLKRIRSLIKTLVNPYRSDEGIKKIGNIRILREREEDET